MLAIHSVFIAACLLPLVLAVPRAGCRTKRAAAWFGIALLAALLCLVDLSTGMQARIDGRLLSAGCGG